MGRNLHCVVPAAGSKMVASFHCMRWSLVHECLATADFFKFDFLAFSVILAIDNHKFSRKMRESIDIEKHSTIDQEG